mgnify:FL=1|jgi:uncharacterized protein (UPF0332 family)
MESKIDWCLKQKRGIQLVEPNNNLASAYLLDADESIEAMDNLSGKWKVVTAYYACYNAFYALLMKAGIKCEIHDCTLALMSIFDFNDDIDFIVDLKRKRIDVQYYLRSPTNIDSQKIKMFVLDCKNKVQSLNEDKINKVRGLLAKND